jgi:predicted RNA-binding Zn ribbon-like protein
MTSTTATTGQWMTGSDGVRWFFDPGALCLEFGYTGDFGYSVAEWERLHSPSDLAAWLGERFGITVNPAPADFADALHLRTSIWRMSRAATADLTFDAADVDTVNEFAARPCVVPILAGGTRPAPPATVPRMLSSIALDAVAVFALAPGRVRECSADDCRLIFFDASRPRTRRWCSMQRCGNRAKNRAHYPRHHD